jgi:hypothetical protein
MLYRGSLAGLLATLQTPLIWCKITPSPFDAVPTAQASELDAIATPKRTPVVGLVTTLHPIPVS